MDWDPAVNKGTGNGFTSHEHLDDVGLVHMNGRVFDPRMGVFLQRDPMLQDPGNLQNYYPYGYCYGSPMGCTDMSGLCFMGCFWQPKNWNPYLRMVVAAVAAYYTGGAAASYFGSTIAGGAIGGFTAGAINSGTMEGAIQGAFSGALFAGVGDVIKAGGYGSTSPVAVTLHGVAGCISSVAGGGKCGPGALSAAFSQGAGRFKSEDIFWRGVQSAVIGGTASVLGGGKFSNGAYTASFGYLFNEALHTEGTSASSNSLQSLKNAFLRPFGIEDTLVIGEDMRNRVIPYANALEGDYYAGLGRTATDAEYLNDNINFIREKMRQGYTIIDIGPSPTYDNYPNITSPYYAAEIVHISTFNSVGGIPAPYQNYKIDAKNFNEWLKLQKPKP